ncbi:hypothetical protein N7488_008588 [Penicillium malachiteum]|nr:hypothetical protein N7488_008588 [Penicillium malachiteum]
MNDKFEKHHDPPLLSNTELMIAIIREVQKVPVAEARALIAREGRNNHLRAKAPSPKVADPIIMQSSTSAKPGSARSRTVNRDPIMAVSTHSHEIPYREDVALSRERRRTRDYGDGNREHYEGGSSSSSILRDRRSNHMLFVPNPPFTQADWHMRNRNKSDTEENL